MFKKAPSKEKVQVESSSGLQSPLNDYVCSYCGSAAGYDGRCGDGPYLVCGCDTSGGWVDDGRGGYYTGRGNPIPRSEYRR